MMLMIRENDLETVLANRRNFIGIAPRLESALTIITGVFYVASAVVMEDLWWKIPMYVLGAIVTIYGIAGVIRKPYTTKQLFKEIAGMNAIASSIIAITEPGISDSNKYLVYWDTKWKCWFFPNRRSTPSVPDDERTFATIFMPNSRFRKTIARWNTRRTERAPSIRRNMMRCGTMIIASTEGSSPRCRILGLLTGRSTSAVIVASG